MTTLLILICIGGPTASGKTALAVALAGRIGGEIVNADSRQIYRLMDIGTAKPGSAERLAVPHHLLDVALPSEDFTLASYVAAAHVCIAEIHRRGRVPLLVGGTGLYLRAVARGYQVPQVPPDPVLRAALEEAWARDPAALVARLRELDPDGAARLDTRNPRRVLRALEVSITLGVPFSRLQLQQPPYRCLTLVLQGERQALYERADARLRQMLAAGFEEEVARLLALGYDTALPAFSALGYRELAASLRGEQTREAAVEATRRATHGFIRRQLTWFRAEPGATYLDGDAPDLQQRAHALIADWLAGSAG